MRKSIVLLNAVLCSFTLSGCANELQDTYVLIEGRVFIRDAEHNALIECNAVLSERECLDVELWLAEQ